jgi:hypothetical protein
MVFWGMDEDAAYMRYVIPVFVDGSPDFAMSFWEIQSWPGVMGKLFQRRALGVRRSASSSSSLKD